MSLSVKPKTGRFFFNSLSIRTRVITRVISVALCIAGAGMAATAPALAASSLTIIADRAKVVKIAGEIGSIIVGNPSFADVSVQKNYIIIHGRNFGQTNILILDDDGNSLADMEVTVIKGVNRNLSIYRGGKRASYACAPKCESTLQVGDDVAYFKTVNESIGTKMGLASKAGKLTAK